jgi:hypothetical protein
MTATNPWSHHLDDDFPVGAALLEVGEGVRNLVEGEYAIGNDFQRLLGGL